MRWLIGAASARAQYARSLLAYASLSLFACGFVLGADPTPQGETRLPTESQGFTCPFAAYPEKKIVIDAITKNDSDMPIDDRLLRAICFDAAYKLAESFDEQGKYDVALRLRRQLASQGDARGQRELGWMYERGKDVPVDLAEAAKWYRLAADQGDAQAQLLLGVAYYLGRGVPTDYQQSVAWWRKAADQGFPFAQSRLGAMYLRGEGVARDYSTAVKLFRQSAQQGDAEGQIYLGSRYLKGEGVPRDLVQAYKWFTIAIANLHDPSDEDLALAKRDREGTARRMTATEVATATRLADKCLSDKYKDCN